MFTPARNTLIKFEKLKVNQNIRILTFLLHSYILADVQGLFNENAKIAT